MRIIVGRERLCADVLDAGAAQHVIEASVAELAPIVYLMFGAMLRQKTDVGHIKTECVLLHNGAVKILGYDAAVNTARGDMHVSIGLVNWYASRITAWIRKFWVLIIGRGNWVAVMHATWILSCSIMNAGLPTSHPSSGIPATLVCRDLDGSTNCM